MRHLAALVSIAVGLALVTCTVATAAQRGSSQANVDRSPRYQVTAEEEVEEEVEWEWGEEEGEEEEFEVGEDGELEPVGGEGEPWEASASGECVVNDLIAQASASNARNTLRLAVSGASNEPARVTVRVWLKGDKGALRLGPLSFHVGRGATMEANLHLDDPEMARVRAAHVFLVHVETPSGEGQCKESRTRLLNARQRSSTRTTWSERLGQALQRP